jgi:hypothetical protein
MKAYISINHGKFSSFFSFFSFLLEGGLARFYSATIIAPIEIIKTIQTGNLMMEKIRSNCLHI